MDRRQLILGLSAFGAAAMALGTALSGTFWAALVLGFIAGGVSNPLYSLAIAYTNDYLEPGDMAAASGGLLFLFGIGAIGGPIVLGRLMEWVGPAGFYLFLALLLAAAAAYAAWRTTRRRIRGIVTPGVFVPIAPTATTVAAGANIEAAESEKRGAAA
jgi:MFS family permease